MESKHDGDVIQRPLCSARFYAILHIAYNLVCFLLHAPLTSDNSTVFALQWLFSQEAHWWEFKHFQTPLHIEYSSKR